MQWKIPPLNKVYEALGAIGDGRIEVYDNTAKVYSSSRNKYYDVIYDSANSVISANDNGSYYQGYLGYPSIAYLLKAGIVDYDKKLDRYLAGFTWKDINQRFENDFEKTNRYIDDCIVKKYDIALKPLHAQLEATLERIMALQLERPQRITKPPLGY